MQSRRSLPSVYGYGLMFIMVGILGLGSPWSAAAEEKVVDGVILKKEQPPVTKEPKDPGEKPKKDGKVPESSSLILLGAGLAGLGIWAWRRNSSKV